jgi:transposase
MIAFGPSHRYYLHREATDMRKSFDGLSGLVRSELGRDPLSGDVFIFLNRRRTHIKLLVWDRSGFVLYYKRLEEGTFELPVSEVPSWDQLVMMLEGVSMKKVRYRKRYRRN